MNLKRDYDVVVIGGGIGGLFAGAILSKNGMKVSVIEKNEEVGGHYSSFRSPADDVLDYGANYLLACNQGGEVTRLFDDLDITDKLSFVDLDYSDRIILKDKTFTFSRGLSQLKMSLTEMFPNSEDEINEYVNWMKQFADNGDTKSSDSGRFFMRYYKEDYKRFVESNITDPELRAILSIRVQEDPASLMLMAGFVTECYGRGMSYPLGGSSTICKALAEVIEDNGGVIITNATCSQIVHEGNKAEKVLFDSGEITSKYVVYNGDPFKLNNLLPNAYSPEKLEGRKIGHSSLSVFLVAEGIDVSKFECGRIYICDDTDVFGLYKKLEAGCLVDKPIIKVHIPTVYDNSLTSPNRQIIRIETDVYHVNSHAKQEDYLRYADLIIERVKECILPELETKIVYKNVMTPIDFENKFLSLAGSGTGWRHNVQNYLINIFPQKSQYDNVFVVGQWGSQGSGIRQIALSAEKVTKEILRMRRKNEQQ